MKFIAMGILAAAISQGACADNIIRTYAPIKGHSSDSGEWVASDALYSNWTASGALYGCSAATPSTDAYVQGVSFTQTVSGCSQDYTRTRQDQETNTSTQAVRDSGNPVLETKTEQAADTTRTVVGTRSENDILFGGREGRAYLSSTGSSYVGMYSRAKPAPATSIGDVQYDKAGDRLQVYFTMTGQASSSGTCYIKAGASAPNGWDPSLSVSDSAKAYATSFTTITAYVSDGSTRVYKMGSVSTAEGGAIRQATVACTDLNAFYKTPGYFTKATISN